MKLRRILIVDDDLPSRIAMEKVLQSHSYETCSCGSGEHAVLKLKEEFFGTLITDFQMPGMDGLELIREAKKIHPEMAAVLVTGLGTEEMRVSVKTQKVNGFFPKPIEWDKLMKFLDALNGKEQTLVQTNMGKRLKMTQQEKNTWA